ncbi:MAG TPA: ferritin-like domain-containing protein [Anaeromyxobacteraceae bacterium]|nr:ferritin-like domain-containing protein [Anaeromyxobacteraceae bacterium]
MRPPTVPLAMAMEPEGGPLARGAAVEPGAFVEDLERELLRSLARLGEQARAAVSEATSIPELLSAALREEIEAAEIAALWLTDEPDLDLRLGLARQVGDEARHFETMGARLRELGSDPHADPRTRAHGPAFRYLKGLQTPAERLAAGLGREAAARLRNGLLAEVAGARGDEVTARLCIEGMGEEEIAHLDFYRRELPRYALTADDQDAARRAMARTIQLAEEAADPARIAKAAPAPPAEPAPTGR